MRAPSAIELLSAWEHGWPESQPGRALTLLGTVLPEHPREALADLTLGRRDAHLLGLREAVFGDRLDAATTCPACDAPLDLSFAASQVRDQAAETNLVSSLVLDGWEVRFRLPTSHDLVALAAERDPAAARRSLAARCVLDARRESDPAAADDLPSYVVTALGLRMAELDPQACVQLACTCPSCGHAWEADLDVGGFLWAEVDAWARRLVRDVHALASAYGWSEREILSMSPWRRRLYLDLVAP